MTPQEFIEKFRESFRTRTVEALWCPSRAGWRIKKKSNVYWYFQEYQEFRCVIS